MNGRFTPLVDESFIDLLVFGEYIRNGLTVREAEIGSSDEHVKVQVTIAAIMGHDLMELGNNLVGGNRGVR
jgi:hypothetical protein